MKSLSEGGLMGLLRTVLLGREDGFRAKLKCMLLGDSGSDTSPDSAYAAPTYGGGAAADPPRPEPPRDITPPEGFEVVLHVAGLKSGEVKEVIAGGTAICVGNVDGEYFAISNTCPHADGPLGEGTLDGNMITCPYHGWAFDLRDGGCQTNASASVETYEVQLKESAVCVRV
jgi:nitrite reductase/ring-hydroxylating ferredoxin subunit